MTGTRGLSTAAPALASSGAAGAAVDNPHAERRLRWTTYIGVDSRRSIATTLASKLYSVDAAGIERKVCAEDDREREGLTKPLVTPAVTTLGCWFAEWVLVRAACIADGDAFTAND